MNRVTSGFETTRGQEVDNVPSLALHLTVIVLEERGIMTQTDVLKRMKEVRDRKKVS